MKKNLLVILVFILGILFSRCVWAQDAKDYKVKDDPHWKVFILDMDLPQYNLDNDVYGSWSLSWPYPYYKRPGYCSVCATKGMFVSNLTVFHDMSLTDIYMIPEVIKLFRCPHCGNLFTEPNG